MKTLKATLAATLIATAAGWGAWELGIAQKVWPDHPQLFDFLLVLATGIVVQIAWPRLMGWQANEQGNRG